jgi:acetyltransferase-like isoleucine patch superfamily enzyme
MSRTLDGAIPSTYAELMRDAEACFGIGDIAATKQALAAALPLAADSHARAEVLGDLAVAAMAETQHRDAVAFADEALRLDPELISAREVLTACSAMRERDAAARMEPMIAERVAQFAALSTCVRVSGTPHCIQPVLFGGRGAIRIGQDVYFGCNPSPGLLSGYGHVESRNLESTISIGDRTMINNSVTLAAEGTGISIGADCLFGIDVIVQDTDGHDLHPQRRLTGKPPTAPVTIGDNVFLGNRVIVTKGVTIGRDTVVGIGSLVNRSLPAGVIAAGTPARVIRELDSD